MLQLTPGARELPQKPVPEPPGYAPEVHVKGGASVIPSLTPTVMPPVFISWNWIVTGDPAVPKSKSEPPSGAAGKLVSRAPLSGTSAQLEANSATLRSL